MTQMQESHLESNRDDPDDLEFVDLLTRSQVRLRGYLHALIGESSDADDVLQETCATLWKKRREYDRQRDFVRWACGIALVEVLRFRRRRATDRLVFSEVVLEALSSDYMARVEDLDRRRELLPGCLAKLTQRERWLIDSRYKSNVTTAQIAQQLGTPLRTIYSSMARIRDKLFHCVRAALAQEGHAGIQ